MIDSSPRLKLRIIFWAKNDLKLKVALISEFFKKSEAAINTQASELKWGDQKVVLDNNNHIRYGNCHITSKIVQQNPLKLLLY